MGRGRDILQAQPAWAEARAGLMIADILPADPARYALQLDYGRQAEALGYPNLA